MIASMPLNEYINEFHGGNNTQFAKVFGIGRTQVIRWLEYGDCYVDMDKFEIRQDKVLLKFDKSCLPDREDESTELERLVYAFAESAISLTEAERLLTLLIRERNQC
jgi:hypothetical protein